MPYPDYHRHGVTRLSAALDIATGNVLGTCYRRHRSVEFLDFLKKIDAAVPTEMEIHLMLDDDGPTNPRWSGSGCRKRRAITRISRPPMPPGSTRSKVGSRC